MMSKWTVCVGTLALGALLVTHSVHAQKPRAEEQRRSDAANEPMQAGGAAQRDTAAVRDAKNGWYAESLKTKDSRLAWWRDARFGCFIHWGPYSVLGGEWKGKPNPGYAEHIMRVDRIPLATYRDEVAANFHPDQFDAAVWVRLIKSAGMRYIIITSKHHDGFAIWPSDVNTYNIHDVSHFNRDPLKELVDAARAQGLHVGFYYSHAFDWQDPNAPGNDWDYDNPGGDKQLFGGVNWYNEHPELVPRIEKYVYGKAIPQLQELISRYHPDILWFDTPNKLPFFEQAAIVKVVRAAGPEIVINGRAARSASVNLGDYQNTADRPAELRPTSGDWEAIPTTNESYGWNKLDSSYKPVSYFIQLVAKSAAKGGNILLNIGPRGDGTINPPDIAILEGIGRWMAINQESIRGTERTLLDRQAWGDSTAKGDTLYLHVFRWPANGRLVVGGLASHVSSAYLLSDPSRKPLEVTRLNATDIAVHLPAIAPDSADSVVVLKSKGPVKAVSGRLLDTNGNNILLGFDASADGAGFSYGDGKTARYYVDGLEKAGNSLHWSMRVDQPATFAIGIRYSTPTATFAPGARFVVRLGATVLTAPIAPSTNERQLVKLPLGALKIGLTGLGQLTVTIEGATSPVHFFEVDLTPEGGVAKREWSTERELNPRILVLQTYKGHLYWLVLDSFLLSIQRITASTSNAYKPI
jgi:alpha-L-fucosidase